MSIEIKGVKEITDALRQMPQKLERKYLKDAVKDAATPLMNELKARAPRGAVHNPVRTFSRKGGEAGKVSVPEPLAESMTIRTGVRKGRNFASITGNFYARFLEYGTRFMAARPFVRPVIDGTGESVLEQVLNRLKSQIESGRFK